MATRTPKTAPARVKRTKPEVQQEFEEIRREAIEAAETADPKSAEATRLHETEIRQSVDGVTVDAVVRKISDIGLEINKALAGVSEHLVAEVQELAAVRQAVALERAEIERLHKIDVAATALDQLIRDYDRERQRLETEIASHRAAWEEEARAVERERKEQEDTLKKQRQREADDFEYRKNLERKKAQDKYDEDMRLLDKKNKEKQEALEKDWAARNSALKEKEEEFARLKKEAETFPARLKAEIDQAAARAAQQAEQRFNQQSALLKKDAEADKRMAELQVRTLEETVARQSAQIAALQQQLDEAKRQVQDIAVKAIEGASGARALSHVNQIAIEQAKNRPQG